jgi:hypothetical protein
MSASESATILHPRHVQVSVSPEKTRLALTFRSEDQTPVTIVLPVAGAAGLQRRLAQSLYLLSVQTTPPPAADQGAAVPATP